MAKMAMVVTPVATLLVVVQLFLPALPETAFVAAAAARDGAPPVCP